MADNNTTKPSSAADDSDIGLTFLLSMIQNGVTAINNATKSMKTIFPSSS